MRQVFEAFRLAYDQGRSQREIARALGLSQSTVNEYLRRFRAAGLVWPLPPQVEEAAVDARLFASDAVPTTGRAVPDWPALHAERKRKGVTLQLLWLEYKQQTPDAYQYTQFCLVLKNVYTKVVASMFMRLGKTRGQARVGRDSSACAHGCRSRPPVRPHGPRLTRRETRHPSRIRL